MVLVALENKLRRTICFHMAKGQKYLIFSFVTQIAAMSSAIQHACLENTAKYRERTKLTLVPSAYRCCMAERQEKLKKKLNLSYNRNCSDRRYIEVYYIYYHYVIEHIKTFKLEPTVLEIRLFEQTNSTASQYQYGPIFETLCVDGTKYCASSIKAGEMRIALNSFYNLGLRIEPQVLRLQSHVCAIAPRLPLILLYIYIEFEFATQFK